MLPCHGNRVFVLQIFKVTTAHKAYLLLLSCSILTSQVAFSQGFLETESEFDNQEQHLSVSLVSDSKTVVPGQSFWLAVRLEMEDGWHVYWENPGGAGAKPEIEWNLPEGFTAGAVQWPVPDRHVLQGLTNYVYEGVVHLMVEILPPAEMQNSPAELKAIVEWTVCSDEKCTFGDEEVSIVLPLGQDAEVEESVASVFKETRSRWPISSSRLTAKALHDGKSLLLDFNLEQEQPSVKTGKTSSKLSLKTLFLAFLGGAVLNLMPCVFPVIGLKIMGFVTQAGEARRNIILHGLVYTLGVLVSFWILATILILLRQGGEELGWGFQLQDPRFVFGLATVLLVFALNLSGLFEFGTSLMGAGSKLTAKSGLGGSFFSGTFATVMSTPCAAPFLAPALGAALVLPMVSSLLVFTSMALGLALPYLALSFFPKLLETLPKPGSWMETFKQFMAFPLYGTIMFLLWTLAGQVGEWKLLTILLMMVIVALSCWIYGHWPRKRLAKVASVFLLVSAATWALPDAPYSNPIRVDWKDAYFYSKLPLVDPSGSQTIIHSQNGGTILQLPLSEYFSEELEDSNGRLEGVLHLVEKRTTAPKVRDFTLDIPLEAVSSDRLDKFLKNAKNSLGSNLKDTQNGLPWQSWSAETVQRYLDDGNPVFVDFTARWCATCQVNKRVALSSERMVARFTELGVIPLKADWTKKGPVIARALSEHGRAAVPFNVIYLPDGGEPIVLPEVLTEGIVLNALAKAEQRMAKLTPQSP